MYRNGFFEMTICCNAIEWQPIIDYSLIYARTPTNHITTQFVIEMPSGGTQTIWAATSVESRTLHSRLHNHKDESNLNEAIKRNHIFSK